TYGRGNAWGNRLDGFLCDFLRRPAHYSPPPRRAHRRAFVGGGGLKREEPPPRFPWLSGGPWAGARRSCARGRDTRARNVEAALRRPPSACWRQDFVLRPISQWCHAGHLNSERVASPFV